MVGREPDIGGEAARDRLIGRLLNDFMDRRARGEFVSTTELLSEHPDLADDLRQHLRLVDDIRPTVDRIDGLIARGVLTPCHEEDYAATLGPYKIIEYIGRGGMGIVLKALDPSLNRTVAIKILRPDLADDQAALGRFEREAKAAAALRHPNIVTVHSVGQEHGVHFIVMEYVDGPSLAEVIAGSHQPSALSLQPDVVRHVFRQLLEALDAAHSAALIHRDVKSSNILLDGWPSEALSPQLSATSQSGKPAPAADPQSAIPNLQSAIVKLADFGLARMRSSQTQLTLKDSVLGTPEYMSPEQARGDENIEHRTDLYSAGVVLYEMLTGRTPFKADTPTATIRRILDEEPADPGTISKGVDSNLASLALRLMAKSAEDRLTSAAEALRVLDANERVTPLSSRRRLPRHFLTVLGGLALIAAASWLIAQLALRSSKITRVRVDPSTRQAIEVRRGNDPTWKTFREFPGGEDIPTVDTVVRLDLDGTGDVAIVAGLIHLYEGFNIVAMDRQGSDLWGLYLFDESGRRWPDCASPSHWVCSSLLAHDLDGEPGDELIAAAHDFMEYATRVSIVDPRTREPATTFWHQGHVELLFLQPDFFGPGRPAIVARGTNNKLDGFEEPLPVPLSPDDEPVAHWDMVSVVMILDPDLATMSGLGPPRTARVPIPPARPHAYAFLDLPEVDQVVARGKLAQRDPPQYTDMFKIATVSPAPRMGDDDMGVWFTVRLARRERTEDGTPGGATLKLDRNLKLLDVVPDLTEPIRSLEVWKKLWVPIIQKGEDLRH